MPDEEPKEPETPPDQYHNVDGAAGGIRTHNSRERTVVLRTTVYDQFHHSRIDKFGASGGGRTLFPWGTNPGFTS